MENLNISSFFSTKIKDFLNKYDTDGSGVIEKENGELANLISGLKSGELGNVDSVSFTQSVGAAKAPQKANSNVDYDQAVKDFNNLTPAKRLNIASDTRSYAQDKLNKMEYDAENAIIQSMYNYPTVDTKMYKNKLGGSLKSAIEENMRAIEESYKENYEKVRKSVQDAVRSYDSRYATNPNMLGVTYFDTEDTRIITGADGPNFTPGDYPSPEELANMSEAQRDAKLEVFAAEVELAYTEAVLSLYSALSNVESAISTNHQNTADSIDEVAQSGNLTHEVVLAPSLSSGIANVDKFNVKDDDPVTYHKFLSEIVDNSQATGIESTELDTTPKDGKFIKDGKIYIRKNGQVYNTNGQLVE